MPLVPRTLFLACALALVAASAEAAGAATIVVRKGGPIDTIQAAVQQAQDGDKIVVTRGVYRENVTATQNDLTFVGKGAVWDGTVIGDEPEDTLTATGDRVRVQGFTFRNGRNQLVLDGEGAVVRGNRFRGAGGSAVQVRGANGVVERCDFVGNTSRAVFLNGADGSRVSRCTIRGGSIGIQVLSSADVLVERCRATRLSSIGVIVSSSDRLTISRFSIQHVAGTGIDISGGANMTIERCRIRNCLTNGISTQTSTQSLIQRNRLSGARTGILILHRGDEGSILDNRVNDAGDRGIVVTGIDGRVQGNTVTGSTGDAIQVTQAAGTEVIDNRCSGAVAYGFSFQDGVIASGNEATECVGGGLFVFGDDNRIEDMTFRDCAARRSGASVLVAGNRNLLLRVDVTGSAGDGFQIERRDNVFESCSATDCAGDGFDVQDGGDNSFDGCRARRCDQAGFENGLVEDTTLTNSQFVDCFVPIASDTPFLLFQGNNVPLEDVSDVVFD